MIQITDTVTLNESELAMTFVRAPGPGGQNVNKTATAVQLRFDAAHTASLTEEVRDRLLRLAGRKATADGVIIIHASRHRTQERNRQDALDRLAALIRAALRRPRPRRRTAPTRTSKERRLDSKRRHSERKGRRRPVDLRETQE